MVRFRNADALSADDRADKVDRVSQLRQCQTARPRILWRAASGFAVAVLLAEFRGGPQRLIDELAVLFLIVRIAYVLTYLGDRPTLRSILWSIGFAINLAIFFMPVIRGFLPV
jgi:uncharacterized MAPEG superfamily protein